MNPTRERGLPVPRSRVGFKRETNGPTPACGALNEIVYARSKRINGFGPRRHSATTSASEVAQPTGTVIPVTLAAGCRVGALGGSILTPL